MFRGRGFIAWFYAVSLCCGFLFLVERRQRFVRRHCFSRSSRKVFGLVEFYVVVGLVEDVMVLW